MGKIVLTFGYVFCIFVLGYVTGLEQNKELINGMSNVLDQCTGDKYGTIKIDGDYFVCGINKL